MMNDEWRMVNHILVLCFSVFALVTREVKGEQ